MRKQKNVRWRNRWLPCIAGVMMLLPALPVCAEEAATTAPAGDDQLQSFDDSGMYTINNAYLSFGYTDTEVTIISCATEMEGDVVIPDTLTGLPVVAIDEGAFYQCTGITSITVPDTVKKIADGAFYGCTALADITLPDGLTELGESCFYQCTALTALTFPDGIETIPATCCSYCESLTEITFPKALTTIADEAFYGVNGLQTLVIPETVTSIGEMAFYFWNQITEVTIPAAVETMGDYVFDGCDALTAIHVAAENPSFCDEDGVLMTADRSTLLKYPPKHSGTSYTVPDDVRKIAGWAFVGAEELTAIDLRGVTELGEDAFYHCTGLQQLTLPATLTELPSGTFTFCSALETMTLPEGLTSIGGFCFVGCTALKTLTIPATVATIDQYAIGFDYDTESETFTKLPDFTMQVLVGTVGMQYAKQNDISYRSNSKLGWVLLIVAAVVLLLVVLGVWIWMRRNRLRIAAGPDKGKPVPRRASASAPKNDESPKRRQL